MTGSRDQNVITWEIQEASAAEANPEWGIPKKVLSAHSHFVEDLDIAANSKYAISASWDKTLRLWDLSKGTSTQTFVDHTKDVLTCSFSADNRQIASGGRDNCIKIWNTVGECKYTSDDQDNHQDWVSCVRFSPDAKDGRLATGSWDGSVKIWDSSSMQLQNTFLGHTNAVTSLCFAQKTIYLASGGRDGNIIMWNVQEGSFLKERKHTHPINQVIFSQVKYCILAAADDGILLWNLVNDTVSMVHVHVGDGQEEESDDEEKKAEKVKPLEKKKIPCHSLAWSKDGRFLYSGWADGLIRVYELTNL